MKKILIMAGGTGGHVFPALAIAKALREKHIEVRWLGTEKGLEARVVRNAEFFLYTISVTGLRRKGLLRLVIAPFQLIFAIFQSLKIIFQYQPEVVLGMGGFVAGPGGVAAWILRKRLVIHEQNAIMGMTNKILSKFADKILTGFPISKKIVTKQYKQSKFFYVGNPVREEIITVGVKKLHRNSSSSFQKLSSPHGEKKPVGRDVNFSQPASINILIFGGSQGASCFNKILPEVIAKLSKKTRTLINLWHQTGKRDFEETKKRYQNNVNRSQTPLDASNLSISDITVKVEPFIENMAKAYEWADLVICRAGALSIAELSAVGIASILVPYPYAVDDHQSANARFLVNHQAAILLPQSQFHASKLMEVLNDLLSNPVQLIELGKKAYQLRKINTTQNIMDYLLNP